MFPEFDNVALRGQHAVAVLVAVHLVPVALLIVQTESAHAVPMLHTAYTLIPFSAN
jgi:hypothetical protein